MTQRRWLCATCQREWLANGSAMGAQPWVPDEGCPGCRSSQIREVAYEPAFPGADIPRDVVAPPPAPALSTREDVVSAPPRVLEFAGARV